MIIGGLQKSSLLDYPGKISAIVFTQGCNFRCAYCHNHELILPPLSKGGRGDSVIDFLKTRAGKLDAVVITGGEPCLQAGLNEFIREIKALGFLVKLDTNGYFPEVLQALLDEKLLDYIAMDIKAPLEKYSNIVRSAVDTDKIARSIEIIMNSGVDYEFRTTVVKSQLSFEDLGQINKLIKGAKKYYLQKYQPSKTLENMETYTDEEFAQILKILKTAELR